MKFITYLPHGRCALAATPYPALHRSKERPNCQSHLLAFHLSNLNRPFLELFSSLPSTYNNILLNKLPCQLTNAPNMATSHPILDSHIHLYPESELTTLSWYTPSNPLGKQHSVSDYRAATSSLPSGFIFVETDRVNESSSSWTAPLAEIAWLKRIITDSPRTGEGHGPGDGTLVKAIVPWAPVDLGPEKVEEYLAKAESEAGEETWKRVKGFRYLLQDKKDGTALGDAFIEGLKVLGRRGFVFDVGVDQHRRGRTQLEEAVEMVDRAHEGVPEEEKVVFVLSEFFPFLFFFSRKYVAGEGEC